MCNNAYEMARWSPKLIFESLDLYKREMGEERSILNHFIQGFPLNGLK